jgi:hypothetical protein
VAAGGLASSKLFPPGVCQRSGLWKKKIEERKNGRSEAIKVRARVCVREDGRQREWTVEMRGGVSRRRREARAVTNTLPGLNSK